LQQPALLCLHGHFKRKEVLVKLAANPCTMETAAAAAAVCLMLLDIAGYMRWLDLSLMRRKDEQQMGPVF